MRLRFKRVTTPQGFSLVEVLIALVILGVGLLGLARLQIHMLGGTAESVVRDSAVRLAEDKLEALRFDLAAGRAPQAGADEPKVNQIVLQRSWTWSNTAPRHRLPAARSAPSTSLRHSSSRKKCSASGFHWCSKSCGSSAWLTPNATHWST